MALPSHLFVPYGDGALYDTRVPGWSNKRPLRENYRRSRRDIETVSDLKAVLRNGEYTDLGGYPLFFLASDGEALSFDGVRENLSAVMGAIQDHDRSGWRVVAYDINYENTELYCAHSGALIPSAYGED